MIQHFFVHNMGLYRYKGKKQDFAPFKLNFVLVIAKKAIAFFFYG